ncbi:hypothetical protein DID77_04555 [Candidatus Marinamargulisbacteria bacterium SCGC AG-439-L15]|nr:hypothetical protein DID77_04555 [Candidatus Marinamargulisbacteria bacterium SCGC AG-439-L15]
MSSMSVSSENESSRHLQKLGKTEDCIQRFSQLLKRWRATENTPLDWESVHPITSSDCYQYNDLANLSETETRDILQTLAVVKLNGGLGTSMGCKGPKSLIPVSESQCFLDCIIQQTQGLNKTFSTNIPLCLMNSISTNEQTLTHLKKNSTDLSIHHFLQNQFPRLLATTKHPFQHQDPNKSQENDYPPGHGDIYHGLLDSGLLEQLDKQGIQYLFISNSDNLAAEADPKILAHLVKEQIPFLMEVCKRSPSDRKGGSLRKDSKGQFQLLEIAQVPTEHQNDFMDTSQFSLFNTNNIWVHIPTLKKHLEQNTLLLDIIENYKEIDGQKVLQLETAMGAAISAIEGACLLEVPRSRFFPIKTTADYLLLRSSLVAIKNGCLEQKKQTLPKLELSAPFTDIDSVLKHIHFPLNLEGLKHLSLAGDVYIEAEVQFKNTVTINIPEGEKMQIEKGRIIDNVDLYKT